jgi:hypothetical protein
MLRQREDNYHTEQLRNLLQKTSYDVNTALNLIRLGADKNIMINGKSLLHLWTQDNIDNSSTAAIIELVETHGADINIKDAKGLTPLQALMNASSFNSENAMDLIRLGADKNTIVNGKSLLHILVENNPQGNQDGIIGELIEIHHADINIKDVNGLSPLECLLNASFLMGDTWKLRAIMNLIRWSSDNPDSNPNIKRKDGQSLLHMLAENNQTGDFDNEITELVENYAADIDVENNEGETPLAYLLKKSTSKIENCMHLVRLGADPDVRVNGESLLEQLMKINQDGDYNDEIKELEKTLLEYYQTKRHPLRNHFLNLVILLAQDKNNSDSNSFFSSLSSDLLSYLLSFLSGTRMQKTQSDCQSLAYMILKEQKKIKEILAPPHAGGINVFQHIDTRSGQQQFSFFRSVHTLIQDHKALRSQLNAEQSYKDLKSQLKQPKQKGIQINKPFIANKIREIQLSNPHTLRSAFPNNEALSIWKEHSSLYKKDSSKLKLFDSIKGAWPYKRDKIKTEIKSQLKIK